MITTSTQTTLKQSDDFKSFQFGIKESGLSHIFNVLRNQLYSDKVLAVIREYSCNAVDAHTEVGKDEPILVTLPNQLSPYFKVRDYGRGLTEKEIEEIPVQRSTHWFNLSVVYRGIRNNPPPLSKNRPISIFEFLFLPKFWRIWVKCLIFATFSVPIF